jgi:hypothetical protein
VSPSLASIRFEFGETVAIAAFSGAGFGPLIRLTYCDTEKGLSSVMVRVNECKETTVKD